MMKRFCKAATTMLLLLSMLTGCSQSQKLSEQFNMEDVKEEAKEVIRLLNEEAYETLEADYWDAVMKQKASTGEMQKNMKPIIDELGGFISIENEAVTGSTDNDTEQEYAVAVIIAKYEKRKAQYTISFNTEMKVAGFYVK